MPAYQFLSSRRYFLSRMGAAGAALAFSDLFIPGVFAEELVRTPPQTEGPFYPDKLPLDTDNDLVILNNSVTPAVGEITQLSGRILDSRGDPVRNAVVEIWQVDSNACYIHSQGAPGGRKRDGNFQGFGRFQTGSTGEYRFRTIKPVVYSSRPPHIHFKVKAGEQELTTQCYVKGHSSNDRDWLIRNIRDARARESLMVEFVPVKGSRIEELAAKFDIVLGFTPSG